MPRNIVDAGPIVAYLDPDDAHHAWAVEQFARHDHFFTCEAAVAESCARLNYGGLSQHHVLHLVERGILELAFTARQNITRILHLMEKYADQPMDFADACLVVMSEECADPLVLTLDRDFKVYRRHGRAVIPTLTP